MEVFKYANIMMFLRLVMLKLLICTTVRIWVIFICMMN